MSFSLNSLEFHKFVRLIFGILFALLVWWTHHVKEPLDGSFPSYYYFTILISYGLHQVISYSNIICKAFL